MTNVRLVDEAMSAWRMTNLGRAHKYRNSQPSVQPSFRAPSTLLRAGSGEESRGVRAPSVHLMHRPFVRESSRAAAGAPLPRRTGLRLTLARVRVGSHLIRVGKAGATPALPRNCEASRDRATPSQTTDRIDGAVTTFAGEGGFRSAARRNRFPCQRARS